jgi:hypothetical protein
MTHFGERCETTAKQLLCGPLSHLRVIKCPPARFQTIITVLRRRNDDTRNGREKDPNPHLGIGALGKTEFQTANERSRLRLAVRTLLKTRKRT